MSYDRAIFAHTRPYSAMGRHTAYRAKTTILLNSRRPLNIYLSPGMLRLTPPLYDVQTAESNPTCAGSMPEASSLPRYIHSLQQSHTGK